MSAMEDVDRQGYEETILQRMSENPRPSVQSVNSTALGKPSGQLGKPSGQLSKPSGEGRLSDPASGEPVATNGQADEETPGTVSPFATPGVQHAPRPPSLLPDRIRAATGRLCQTRMDLAHLLLCTTSAVLFGLLFGLYDNGAQVHQSTRMWFFSIVVAPLGCYIRWQLGRLNFQVE